MLAAEADLAVGGCPAGAGADTLALLTDVSVDTAHGDHHGSTGLPPITTEIVIAGRGFTIQRPGSASFRIFGVAPGGFLTLRDVTVRAIADAPDWGTDFFGGVLRNDGRLETFAAEIVGGTASADGPGFVPRGGAVYNAGDAVFTDSVIRGTGYALRGAGFYNAGDATLVRSEVDGFAGIGGAVANEGRLSWIGGSVDGLAVNSAGALHNASGAIATLEDIGVTGTSWADHGCITNLGSLTATRVSVTGCRSNADVGAIFNGGELFLTNTTVSGNTAGLDPGQSATTGGLDSPGALEACLVTIVDNEVHVPGPGNPIGGVRVAQQAFVEGSIVADNRVRFTASGFLQTVNCGGSPVDLGGNFADDETCGEGFGPIAAGPDYDPVLADNGGPTPTHALTATSVALDTAGPCATDVDQRGFLRVDGSPDSGAYEFEGEGCADGTAPVDWYPDADGDGFGAAPGAEASCDPPPGFVGNDRDCDDADAQVNPDAPEVCGDGIDNDCDPGTPFPEERAYYLDHDGDGYGDDATVQYSCEPQAGYVDSGGDCDDTDPLVNPGGTEACGDGVDNDCSPDTLDAWDQDFDGTTCDLDCDDANGAIWLPAGPVANLRFWVNPQVLLWDAPAEPGATTLRYELLRSPSPSDFVSETWCRSTNFDSTSDTEIPTEQTVLHYLVRGTNGCAEPGSLGSGTNGQPRDGTCR